MAPSEHEPYLMPNGSVVLFSHIQYLNLSAAWQHYHPSHQLISMSRDHFYVDIKNSSKNVYKIVPQRDEARLWLLMNYQEASGVRP